MPKTPKPDTPELDADFGFITDRQASELGLAIENAHLAIGDATLLYAHVNRHPHITRGELVKYANSKWGEDAVDRLNTALAFLQRAGKLLGS